MAFFLEPGYFSSETVLCLLSTLFFWREADGCPCYLFFLSQEEKRRLKEEIERRRAEAAEKRQKMPEDGLSDDKKPFKCFAPKGSSLKVFFSPENFLIRCHYNITETRFQPLSQLLIIQSLCFLYLFAPFFSNFIASFCYQDMERREIKWRICVCLLDLWYTLK